MMRATANDVEVSPDGSTVTVRVPMQFRRRGCRKVVIAPGGTQVQPHWAPQWPRVDSTLVRALARAFRWQAMLDGGRFNTVSELAKAEKLDISYVAHTIRLALLAPDLVEAILDGKQPATMQLQPLMRGFPVEWERQRAGVSQQGL
ncbi:MAG TPA: hypothetical protein VGN97_10095 [Mesorhizobium sp.]|jgi:hypothetical protein|nr:hypothetical protein [Mesorhizobium sp.]